MTKGDLTLQKDLVVGKYYIVRDLVKITINGIRPNEFIDSACFGCMVECLGVENIKGSNTLGTRVRVVKSPSCSSEEGCFLPYLSSSGTRRFEEITEEEAFIEML
jgi:hypothetical protein